MRLSARCCQNSSIPFDSLPLCSNTLLCFMASLHVLSRCCETGSSVSFRQQGVRFYSVASFGSRCPGSIFVPC
jgi:hypothetical protein